jgi:hypothetical protein
MSSEVGHSSVLCAVCRVIKTNHRCMEPVKRGLLMVDVIGYVCGRPVCGPCNFKHGNESLFRCPMHSTVSDESSDESVTSANKENVGDKGNAAVVSSSIQQVKTTLTKQKSASAKGRKGNEYSAKDLLILSQAYIKTSENAIDRTNQRQSKFWDEVAVAFNQLKKQQEAYDARHEKRQKFNAVNLKSDFLTDSDEDVERAKEAAVVIPTRTSSSLQQKWSKFVLPYVTKFIALSNRPPKASGEGMFCSVSVDGDAF